VATGTRYGRRMDAVLVVGGLGTRLRPLTVHRPKQLLPVAGVPFLAHQIAKLASAGIDRVVLATSYRAAEFEQTFGSGHSFGVELLYVIEAEPLGTAGAVRNVTDRLSGHSDDPVVVLNGDILSSHDLTAQLSRHRDRRADVTLHLVEVDDPRPFGCVPTDASGLVTAFMEKSPDPVSSQVNAGCYVFNRTVIDEIPSGRAVSIERETFPALLAQGCRVLAYTETAYWLDLGTPSSLIQASCDLVRGIAQSPAYGRPPAESLVLPGAVVAPSATISGGSTIGSGAEIEAEAVVQGSIVMDSAIIGKGASVIGSAVGPRARVGAGTRLRDAVIGDEANVGEGCELVNGVRVWCGATLGDGAVRFSTDA
jgi:mannose-1-phosphate guanylyltransferase